MGMGNLATSAVRRLPWKRSSQEDIDLWRVYQLIYYREKSLGEEIKIDPVKQGTVSPLIQKRIVDNAITQQIKELLANDPATLPPKQSKFSLEVIAEEVNKESSLNGAEFHPAIPGVKLIGNVSPGTVTCFFPGTIYSKAYVPLMDDYPHISTNNPYLMATTNGCIIDAKHYNKPMHHRQDSTSNNICFEDNGGSSVDCSDQYAIGHLIRHPLSPDLLPNVMPYTLVVPSDNLVSSLIPNKYYKIDPSTIDKTILTIVFIAMRHIKNEELLLNYRLHPESMLPSWYSSLDSTEDKRRWKEIKHI